jgi:DNA-binding transcriptional ArsR family regulator
MSKRSKVAPVFAALGDPTRLELVDRLSTGDALSIAQLSAGRRMTRQAITKHLRVLQRAGLARSHRRGREQRWSLEGQPLSDAQRELACISRQWDDAIERLRSFVEG